ncbi:MAG TPA: hypothetical protein VFX59_21650 [Polyangiales bacterium]|nr:hypothetical protein [Polyangiales bacterium]
MAKRRPPFDYVGLERELKELAATDPKVKAAEEKLYAETNRIVLSAAAERRIRADERAKVLAEVEQALLPEGRAAACDCSAKFIGSVLDRLREEASGG